jgi:hypothetical protein
MLTTNMPLTASHEQYVKLLPPVLRPLTEWGWDVIFARLIQGGLYVK